MRLADFGRHRSLLVAASVVALACASCDGGSRVATPSFSPEVPTQIVQAKTCRDAIDALKGIEITPALARDSLVVCGTSEDWIREALGVVSDDRNSLQELLGSLCEGRVSRGDTPVCETLPSLPASPTG